MSGLFSSRKCLDQSLTRHHSLTSPVGEWEPRGRITDRWRITEDPCSLMMHGSQGAGVVVLQEGLHEARVVVRVQPPLCMKPVRVSCLVETLNPPEYPNNESRRTPFLSRPYFNVTCRLALFWSFLSFHRNLPVFDTRIMNVRA